MLIQFKVASRIFKHLKKKLYNFNFDLFHPPPEYVLKVFGKCLSNTNTQIQSKYTSLVLEFSRDSFLASDL